jgi:nucleoid DNA-binding protein
MWATPSATGRAYTSDRFRSRQRRRVHAARATATPRPHRSANRAPVVVCASSRCPPKAPSSSSTTTLASPRSEPTRIATRVPRPHRAALDPVREQQQHAVDPFVDERGSWPYGLRVESVSTVEQGWTRIEAWLARAAPEVRLPDGAPPSAIAAANVVFDGRLSAEFMASLARHDGDLAGLFDCEGPKGGGRAIPGVLQQIDTFEAARLPSDLWPLGADDDGYLALGTDGSVVSTVEDGPKWSRRTVAPTFGRWLNRIAENLESGDYGWHVLFERIVSQDELGADNELLPSTICHAAQGGAADPVGTVAQQIGDSLAAGRTVKLPGLGVLSVHTRRAFRRTDPRTGLLIDVPARTLPVFLLGDGLNAMLNGEPSLDVVPEGDVDGELDWWDTTRGGLSRVLGGVVLAEVGRRAAEALCAESAVGWPGVGEFTNSKRRTFKDDPPSDRPLDIPERRIVVFRAAKRLLVR